MFKIFTSAITYMPFICFKDGDEKDKSSESL